MTKKDNIQLIEGSSYRIYSIGGREKPMETEGIFKGYTSFGIDDGGLILELNDKHGEDKGIYRIVPLHAILAIDVLDEILHEKKEDEKEHQHFYS